MSGAESSEREEKNYSHIEVTAAIDKTLRKLRIYTVIAPHEETGDKKFARGLWARDICIMI